MLAFIRVKNKENGKARTLTEMVQGAQKWENNCQEQMLHPDKFFFLQNSVKENLTINYL